MCRNDKNILKATAIFVVALIVFGFMNYHHTVILNRITKDSIQKQINKYKEDSCKIVEYEKLRREREQEEEYR
jgi:hypothetical protein